MTDQHGSYDTHSGELLNHATLWDELSNAIGDFFTDLEEHGLEDDAMVTVFSEYPSLKPADQVESDTACNNHFRGLYSTLLEDWMGIDLNPIIGSNYEQFDTIVR